jgi:hypothetical protein
VGLLVVALFLLAVVLCGLAGAGVNGGPRLHLGFLGCAAGWLALLLSNWPGDV